MNKKPNILIIIIIFMFIAIAISVLTSVLHELKPCVEEITVCQKEEQYLRPYSPLTGGGGYHTVYKDISCDEEYDREIRRCIKRG